MELHNVEQSLGPIFLQYLKNQQKNKADCFRMVLQKKVIYDMKSTGNVRPKRNHVVNSGAIKCGAIYEINKVNHYQ